MVQAFFQFVLHADVICCPKYQFYSLLENPGQLRLAQNIHRDQKIL